MTLSTLKIEVLAGLYLIGTMVLPPLLFGGKSLYFSELVLILILFLVLAKGGGRKLARETFSRPWFVLLLAWTWVAFFSGLQRGQQIANFSPYLNSLWTTNFDDAFRLNQDLTRALRWSLIFMSPLIFETALVMAGADRKKLLHTLITSMTIGLLISVTVGLLGYTGLVDMKVAGFFNPLLNPNWIGRFYGTFSSPVDASIVYGFCFLFLVQTYDLKKSAGEKLRLVKTSVVLAAAALILTRGLASIIWATVLTLYFWRSLYFSRTKFILFLLAIVIFLGSFGLAVGPLDLVFTKIGALNTRSQIWNEAFYFLTTNSLRLFNGWGFTSIAFDNSLLSLTLYGGLTYCVFFIFYMRDVTLGLPTYMIPSLTLWLLSFLTLDSVGYWGIGRISWFFIGIGLYFKKDDIK